MDFPDEKAPLHSLLSSYTSAALAHVAAAASFIIAMFAYMGLSLKSSTRSWGIGSLLVLLVLASLIVYNLGRLGYFSTLTAYITSIEVYVLFSPTLYQVSKKLQELLENDAKASFYYRLIWEFRKSFRIESIVMSIVLGAIGALVLYVLGWLVYLYE
jgi:hypothetical protein